jgi:hypothetical protein
MFSTSWFLTALSLDTILGPPECQFPPFSWRNSLKQNIILSTESSPLWKHGDKNGFSSLESYTHTHTHTIIRWYRVLTLREEHQEQQSLSVTLAQPSRNQQQNEHLSVIINVVRKLRFTGVSSVSACRHSITHIIFKKKNKNNKIIGSVLKVFHVVEHLTC